MNAEQLIAAVEKRRPLWDIRVKQYTDRNVNLQMWKEVAAEMGFSKTDVQKKFKNLRDTYRVELKREDQSIKLGVASEKRKKWIFTKQMSFLKDIMSTNLHAVEHKTSDPLCFESAANISPTADFNQFDLGDIVETTFSPVEEISNIFEQSKRLKKQKIDNATTALAEKIEQTKNTCETHLDGDYNFLMSFLPVMQEMTQIQKLEFRAQMSNVALNIMRPPIAINASTGTFATQSTNDNEDCKFSVHL